MEINYGKTRIRSFAISPRTLEAREYWKNIESVGGWCRDYQFTGPLLFTGNDTYVEPWVCAQRVIDRYGVSPLVAVNPVYMHPFSVAKMVTSYAYAFGKRIYLNMVTGTSLSQHVSLDDNLDHDQKYDRLSEYVRVVQMLTERAPAAVTFEGKYYTVRDLALRPPVGAELMPGYFIAGHSDRAQAVRRETGAVGMQMLQPGLAEELGDVEGIHFGLMTRPTEEAAWAAAEERFPESARGKYILERSMANTDSVWKQRLKFAADTMDQCENGYWLAPFRSFQADCPYFIGGRERVKDLLVSLIRRGVRNIILDIPQDEGEFAEVAAAFKMAERELEGDFDGMADPADRGDEATRVFG